MVALRTLAMVAALLVASTADAGWSVRSGGGLGRLVSTTTAAGDELFVFCANNGLGFGIIPRVSTKPGGPADLVRVPITVAVDDGPATALTVEGYDGAWVTVGAAPTLAQALAQARKIVVTVAPSHALGFEEPRPVFTPGGGLAAAAAKAGLPARCRPK